MHTIIFHNSYSLLWVKFKIWDIYDSFLRLFPLHFQILENGKSSENVKCVAKKGKRTGKKTIMQNWGNFVFDLLKYPFAIILFNMSLFLFVKMKMTDESLEIVLRETNPKFY